MVKPTILAVDDDRNVLQSVTRDLRHEFGGDFRLISASSGEEALEALRTLKLRNEPVALFLVDQRMPHMTGVEFLEQAIPLFPDAKRVLLTAYADIDAAIRAINVLNIDHYLTKPWDPPEERLYPPLQDVLDDWWAAYRPPFEGVRVVGLRWSPASHTAKRFLALNQVPYQWLDVETNENASQLLQQAGLDQPHLPVLFFTDGSFLENPSTSTIASHLGLQTEPARPFYDLVIVGAGPAGLGAAVYGASEGLGTLLIERAAPGGQAGTTSRIENYLGFPIGLSGADLTRRAVTQARRLGAEILSPQEATHIRLEDPYRIVTLSDGREVSCHVLIIATGVSYQMLNVPGVEKLTGAGVYYGAAMSEALGYRDQTVHLVGAGNSAGQAAMHFSKYASRVVMLVRGSSLTKSMSQYLIDQLSETSNVEILLRTEVVEACGDDHLEQLVLWDRNDDTQTPVDTDALFIFIGARPQTDWLDPVLQRDKLGYLLCGPDVQQNESSTEAPPWSLDRPPYLFETNVPGIFVVGDVRHGSVKRVATAVGEGAMAVQMVHQYLGEL